MQVTKHSISPKWRARCACVFRCSLQPCCHLRPREPKMLLPTATSALTPAGHARPDFALVAGTADWSSGCWQRLLLLFVSFLFACSVCLFVAWSLAAVAIDQPLKFCAMMILTWFRPIWLSCEISPKLGLNSISPQNMLRHVSIVIDTSPTSLLTISPSLEIHD